MHRSSFHSARKAFTLIELLVVIAIISILSVVVILTLNPAELLRQGRDANRVSDMSTLTSALGVYTTDQNSGSSFSMGSANTIYVSIADPTATSTAGDQCQGLGLATLPTGYAYHCAASSTVRNVNGTGWIPVNFSSISSGSPIGNLPVDPTNTTSSRFYYTYTTNGVQYETTAPMESAKYGVGGSGDVISSDGGTLASVYEKGTKLGLEPLDYGDNTLVGYWPLTEGTGTIAYDYSGSNATGSWTGTQGGTNGYYSVGKIGPYAGAFDGTSTYVNLGTAGHISGSGSISFWFNTNVLSYGAYGQYPVDSLFSINSGYQTRIDNTGKFSVAFGTGSSEVGATWANSLATGTWYYAVGTVASNGLIIIYMNGVQVATSSFSYTFNGNSTQNLKIGNEANTGFSGFFNGLIDDVRIYNRVLSAPQIAAMYNGGK